MCAAYIGIDGADRKHDIYLWDCATGEAEECVISSQPDAIAAWVEGLRKRYGTALLAVWKNFILPNLLIFVTTVV